MKSLAASLAALVLAPAAALLLGGGCSQETMTAPDGAASLSVRVVFVRADSLPVSGKGAEFPGASAIRRVEARAYELIPGSQPALRREVADDLEAGQTRFELVLTVPPAGGYLVRVEAIGTREAEAGPSRDGVVFAGEGEVDSLRAGDTAEVEVLMREIVPAPRLFASPGAPLKVVARWRSIWRAQAYRVLEEPSGNETVTPETTFTPGAAGGQAGSASYRVRAELASGIVSAFSESLLVTSSAACSLSVFAIGFGPVDVGSSADRSFTIHNTGTAPLAGDASVACEAFEILDGFGPFTLPPGGSRTVQVRFTPAAPGDFECTVATGAACGGVALTGSGRGSAVCSLDPAELDFGTVLLGASADRSFTIRNDGNVPLAGSIAEVCGGFTVISAPGAFELPPGASREVIVRFTPATSGEHACALSLGTEACPQIPCSGIGDRAASCEVSPAALDFGAVVIGHSATRRLVVRNVGGGLLAGRIQESCDAFEIEGGPVDYSLAGGDSVAVNVRFTPAAPGDDACSIASGPDCGAIPCTGRGEAPAACDVSPAALDFGTVLIGRTASRRLVVRNAGGGVLEGRIAESCDAFEIDGGPADYSLAAGESLAVSVVFQPSVAGDVECSIDTGSSCGALTATGRGEAPAACEVSPAALDFGSVGVNGTSELRFTIRNTGGSRLAGEVTEACPEFDVRPASYDLAAGESLHVAVSFTPAAPGEYLCAIDTGTGCDPVACTGSAEAAPVCEIVPAGLSFAAAEVGDSLSLPLVIRNAGGGTLSGVTSAGCGDFRIEGGAAAYDLAAGESLAVTVWFAPRAEGQAGCALDLGLRCGPVECSGSGYALPACGGVPASLDFGDVGLNGSAERSFTIRNDGGGLLEGIASSPCAEFEIVEGTDAYSLAPGAEHTVRVAFVPGEAGPHDCVIETGSDLCLDVACSGNGFVPCEIAPPSLAFSATYVNGTSEKTFTITNTGTEILSGAVSESCPHYSIPIGGGPYALSPGASRIVTVRFAPTAVGTHACAIATGTYCEAVECSGQAISPCRIDPPSLDFGPVTTGSAVNRTFTIVNDGPASFSGDVTESCPDFAIVGGGGSYTLAPGSGRAVTVRFQPTAAGTRDCTISTGTLCDPLEVTGTGTPPSCTTSPDSLYFSTYDFNPTDDLTFTLTNTGAGLLTGNVSIPPVGDCASFRLIGPASYVLRPGERANFTVRFEPQSYGSFGCVINTGGPCRLILTGSNVIGATGGGERRPR